MPHNKDATSHNEAAAPRDQRALQQSGRFERFIGLIAQINKEIQRLKAQHMAQFDLRGTDVMCLVCLRKHPEGIPAADIARSISVDRALVSRSIHSLRTSGLVASDEREDAGTYRRPVFLTEKGKALATQVNGIIAKMVNKVDRDLAQDDVAVMYRVLTQILENLTAL